MRLICPECHNNVTVPDDAAGKEATCPNCGKSFPTPARYTAAVSEAAAAVAGAAAAPPGLVPPVTSGTAAPPPGFVPPAPTSAAPADGFLTAATNAAGYTKAVGVTVAPHVVAWLPAALLTVVFVLTFFPWVGSHVGDSAVNWQRVWGAAFSKTPGRNIPLEQSQANAVSANHVSTAWLSKMKSDWEMLVPFLLLLVLALGLAWAERVLRATGPRAGTPLSRVWPQRNAIVAGLAGLALVFLLWEMARGFPMERAIKQHVTEQKAAERQAVAAEKPNTPTPDADVVKYQDEQAYQAYDVEWTWWLYLSLLCLALAVAAVLVHVALERRGNRPPPRLVLHY